MKHRVRTIRKALAGFTIMEVMVASIVSVIILGGATVALIQGLQVWQQEGIKSELNLDLEISMEHLRQDLRLSSVGIGLMAFYSTNGTDYSAISMPLSDDTNNDGLLDRDDAGNIIWNKTVVYHVRPGTPDQLLRTVFDNRIADGTAADFYAQLSNVVASTAMSDLVSCCLTGETVTSRTIFQNLVNLRFTPPDIYFDGYWPSVGHAGTYNWGSIVLGSGPHDLDFVIEGKNDLSSGYRLEVDRIALSASAGDREGEIYLPNNSHPVAPFYQSSASGGVMVAVERGSGWTWGGNAAINMTGGGTGSTLTLTVYNDLWCDTDFRDPGPKEQSNCAVSVDSVFRVQDPFIWDTVVAPDKGIAWTAEQVAEPSTPMQIPEASVVSITNMIYGGTNIPSMTINRSGAWLRLAFERPPGYSMLISNVVATDLTLGLSTNATFNGGDNYVLMDVDGPLTTNSDWIADVEIDRAHDYAVSFEASSLSGDDDLDLFFGGSGAQDIKFYENTGTKSVPVFVGSVPNWQGINEAAATIPGFGDLDGDGDFDLMLGVVGAVPRYKYFRNDGSVKTPNMVLVDPAEIPGSFYLSGSGTPSPTLVDLDADGDLDVCSGWIAGWFQYNQNTGTAYSMAWSNSVFLVDNTNAQMDVGANAAPEFADIDGDGDYDLFSGRADDGGISFWENTGTAQVAIWDFKTNGYGGITNSSTHCIVRFADMNGDGDLDMIVGNLIGAMTTYENTGSVNNALWAPGVVQNGMTAGRAAPALCNIDAETFGITRWTNGTVLVPLGYEDGVATDTIFGLTSFEVGYAKESVYRSGIYDTAMDAPDYNELNWTQVEDSANGWDVDIRIRSSSDRKMRDMTDIDWQDASAGDGGYMNNNSGNSLATLPKKRYVQYEARFKCNEDGLHSAQHTNEVPGAKLRDVTIDWPGETGLCDLLVSFGRGPDCGVVNVTVDGQEFIKGVQVDMTIFKEGRTGLNSANGVLEVRPLNTGK